MLGDYHRQGVNGVYSLFVLEFKSWILKIHCYIHLLCADSDECMRVLPICMHIIVLLGRKNISKIENTISFIIECIVGCGLGAVYGFVYVWILWIKRATNVRTNALTFHQREKRVWQTKIKTILRSCNKAEQTKKKKIDKNKKREYFCSFWH